MTVKRKTWIITMAMIAVLLMDTALMVNMSILAGSGKSGRAVQVDADSTERVPLGFDVEIEPEHPTAYYEVSVTVTFLDVPSISYAFGFGALNQVDNVFSVCINVSIPMVVSFIYAGNVTYTYELGELSAAAYNFSATVHYVQQLPDGTWSPWPSDYSYGESFAVSESGRGGGRVPYTN
jgi:hypothetical protein